MNTHIDQLEDWGLVTLSDRPSALVNLDLPVMVASGALEVPTHHIHRVLAWEVQELEEHWHQTQAQRIELSIAV